MLRSKGGQIIVLVRTHQGPDGGEHRLRHQHHLQPERTGDIHRRGDARGCSPCFDVAITGAGYAGQIGDLLLGQAGGRPRLPQEVTKFV